MPGKFDVTFADLPWAQQCQQQEAGRQSQAAQQGPHQRADIVADDGGTGQQDDEDRIGRERQPVWKPLYGNINGGQSNAQHAKESERHNFGLAAEPAEQQRQHSGCRKFQCERRTQAAAAIPAPDS